MENKKIKRLNNVLITFICLCFWIGPYGWFMIIMLQKPLYTQEEISPCLTCVIDNPEEVLELPFSSSPEAKANISIPKTEQEIIANVDTSMVLPILDFGEDEEVEE